VAWWPVPRVWTAGAWSLGASNGFVLHVHARAGVPVGQCAERPLYGGGKRTQASTRGLSQVCCSPATMLAFISLRILLTALAWILSSIAAEDAFLLLP
jgi:hypothetical protein